MEITAQTTLGELLARFPNGFAVSCTGTIDEIVAASSHFGALAGMAVDLPAEGGGFLAVKPTGERCVNSDLAPQRPSR